MKVWPIVPTLLKLVKNFDDFVAPAATRVLCSLLPEGVSMRGFRVKRVYDDNMQRIYGEQCLDLECSPISLTCSIGVLTRPSK